MRDPKYGLPEFHEHTCWNCGHALGLNDMGCAVCDLCARCTPAAGNCLDCRDARVELSAELWTPEVPC